MPCILKKILFHLTKNLTFLILFKFLFCRLAKIVASWLPEWEEVESGEKMDGKMSPTRAKMSFLDLCQPGSLGPLFLLPWRGAHSYLRGTFDWW